MLPQMMPLPWILLFIFIFFAFYLVFLFVSSFYFSSDSINKVAKVSFFNICW